jgi:translation initiation factor 3 subunit H
VHIDGLAVLKIVKHCKDALPNLVSGAILGLDQKSVLEITHCFPGLPSTDGRAAEHAAENQKYQLDMMTSLREVNVDNNLVGWYQSMLLGTFNSAKLIADLTVYHEKIPNSVVLLYDPIQTASGLLTLRAFRLSAEFLELAYAGNAAAIAPGRILEELPLKIRNPGIINAMLFDLKGSRQINCDFERLDLSTNPYLEKNLEYLSSWVDDLANEQYKFQQELKRDKWRKKQREQGGVVEDDDQAAPPDRMMSLLMSNQISQYCSQIHSFTGASFGKLFLAGSLQKSDA